MSGEHTLQRPAVSVVLPTFNRLQYLRPAVDSVFAQTYDDWELVIADDGSDEETRTYLGSLALLPRVKVLWLQHSGNPGAVRNAALREARGEYVAFLDSDDLWMPSKLELQMRALRAGPRRHWSYTAFNQINHAGEQINAATTAKWMYYEGDIFQTLLTLEAGVAMPTVIASRRIIEQAGGFDERQRLHEHYHLWLRLAMQCEIGVIRQPLASVRCHNEHFSDFGVDALMERDIMLERILPLVTDSRRRSAVRTARARNAGLLAAANAAAGSRSAAWRTVSDSWRFSWRCGAWWAGIVKVPAHLYLPSRVRTLIREYRRTARQASRQAMMERRL
jgi:glycosyltransferase involved in cell wall biosynthesis